MGSLVQMGLTNALLAGLLAALALAAGRFSRRPARVHSLWVLVLLKLVTPPLVLLPVPGWRTSEPAAVEAPAAPRDAAEGQLAQLPPDPVPPARAEEPLAMMNVEDLALTGQRGVDRE